MRRRRGKGIQTVVASFADERPGMDIGQWVGELFSNKSGPSRDNILLGRSL